MKTLIIIGHANSNSFTHSIAKSYEEGIYEKGDVKTIDLATLRFDPILRLGFQGHQELEPDLVEAQRLILWADHLTFVFPIWWSLYPAILKGFIDRVFLPDFSFKYIENSSLPLPLLKGRTGEIIATSDAPSFFRKYILGDPAIKALKRDTLKFCGVKVTKVTRIGSVRGTKENKLIEILNGIRKKAAI